MLSVLSLELASCQESRTVKVTVTEEDGTPIENVDTLVTFLGYTGEQTKRVKGETDAKGVFVAKGRPPLRMGVVLEKKGYYPTKSGRLSRIKDHDVTYVLRRVRNPIPLYAKKAVLIMPELDKPFGYDFKIGDWVAPHGNGKNAMCFFQMSKMVITDNEHTQKLTVTFPNKEDGGRETQIDSKLLSSQFAWLYNAPQNGYTEKIFFLQKRMPQKGLLYVGRHSSYAIRLNSEINKSGNVVTAHYARIDKGLSLFGILTDKPGFKFTYYYNSTSNDRNLEFDPKRNLFRDLDATEMVHDP